MGRDYEILRMLEMLHLVWNLTKVYLLPVLIPLLLYAVGCFGITHVYHMVQDRRKRS